MVSQMVAQEVERRLSQLKPKKKPDDQPPVQLAGPNYSDHLSNNVVISFDQKAPTVTAFMRLLIRAIMSEKKDYSVPVKSYNEHQKSKMVFLKACVNEFYPSKTRSEQASKWASCMVSFNDVRFKTMKQLENRDYKLVYDPVIFCAQIVKRRNDEN